MLRGIVAGAIGSTGATRGSSAKVGGAQSEAMASPRGASSQAGTFGAGIAANCVVSGADWLKAGEAQKRIESDRREIPATCIGFILDGLAGAGSRGRFQKLRYWRNQDVMSMPALNRKVLAALPEDFY
jgi:hypothetical protein